MVPADETPTADVQLGKKGESNSSAEIQRFGVTNLCVSRLESSHMDGFEKLFF